jgi:hypothetical protein
LGPIRLGAFMTAPNQSPGRRRSIKCRLVHYVLSCKGFQAPAAVIVTSRSIW